MIEIPVHNAQGQQVGSITLDEALFGGEVRPDLLKQAYVRYHANARQGSAKTRNRSEVEGSTKKLYRQKGTGNARRGDRKTNILRGGGHAHAKRPRSFRKDMPTRMRRLANRNAILAKAVDGEIRLVDSLKFEKPSTKQFVGLLESLKIDRSCLFALASTNSPEAKSAKNIPTVSLTQIDRLNAFDLLNHRYLLAERSAFEAYIERAKAQALASRKAQEVAK